MSRLTTLAFGLILLAGCAPLIVAPQPPPSGHMYWSGSPWAPYSSGYVSFGNSPSASCAGKVTLAAGAATVTDRCFTPDAVVVCTDTTAAKAVRCTPEEGALSLSGTAGDVVSYARMQ